MVITHIPAGTSKADREFALANAKRIADGTRIGKKGYKMNWAEYHKRKRAENLKLL